MGNIDTTVAIAPQPDTPPRKVTKIIAYGAGGFGLLTPYHSAQSGFLAKVPVDYNRVGRFAISLNDTIGFTVEDRVKLSYHPDGFAQFSSEAKGRVISGRDPQTGEPKGLGLMTSPLSDPIRTGPSAGITLWGLDQFEALGNTRRSIVFLSEETYYRGCTPDSANAWLIEFFVFPNRYWAGVRNRGGRYVLSMAFRDFEASSAVIELVVIPLPGQSCFIGAFASRLHGRFPSPSGWILGGPGQRSVATGKGHILQAFYPRDVTMEPNTSSLNRAHTST